MPELDLILRPIQESIVDVVPDNYASHGRYARRYSFAERDHVRDHAIALSREAIAEAAEGADEFVKNQQNVVIVADRPEPVEIADRRRQNIGRAKRGFDNERGDG